MAYVRTLYGFTVLTIGLWAVTLVSLLQAAEVVAIPNQMSATLIQPGVVVETTVPTLFDGPQPDPSEPCFGPGDCIADPSNQPVEIFLTLDPVVFCAPYH